MLLSRNCTAAITPSTVTMGQSSDEEASVISTPMMLPISAPTYGIRFRNAKITPISRACLMPMIIRMPPSSTVM